MRPTPAELFDCERVNHYLDSYLLGQVPPPERRGMRLHIHRCPACFEKVAARDPLQLFAPLADQSFRDEIWDGFWPAISAGIAASERRPGAGRLWVRAAAIALLVGAAGAAMLYAPRIALRPGAGTVAPAPFERAASPLPQTVERVRNAASRDVQVFSMSYAGGTAPSQPAAELVLIVDAGLEL